MSDSLPKVNKTLYPRPTVVGLTQRLEKFLEFLLFSMFIFDCLSLDQDIELRTTAQPHMQNDKYFTCNAVMQRP